MVHLEFLLAQGQASEETDRASKTLIGSVLKTLEAPENFHPQFIVAEPERFGDAVERFDPTRTYTNGALLAVGKTFRRKDDPKQSSIILHSVPFVMSLKATEEFGSSFVSWPAEYQRSIYVIAHELGHGLDHHRRPEIEDDGTERDEAGRRRIRGGHVNLCRYHLAMALPELAACALSGHWTTKGVIELDIQMNNETVLRSANEILQATQQSSRDLGNLRQQVVGLAGFFLVQHAKLVGSEVGSGEKLRPMEDLWHFTQLSSEAKATMDDIDSFLRAMLKSYPKWDTSGADRLISIFDRLVALLGYELHDKNGAEGIWWYSWRQMLAINALDELAGEANVADSDHTA
jgi:hypothetical protein